MQRSRAPAFAFLAALLVATLAGCVAVGVASPRAGPAGALAASPSGSGLPAEGEQVLSAGDAESILGKVAWIEPVGDGTYFARAAGADVAIDATGITVDGIRIAFANPATQLVPLDPAPGVTNVLKGPESGWRVAIPHYQALRLLDVAPGIDVVVHADGPDARLEWDFIVAPGADPSGAYVTVSGHERLEARPDGGVDIVRALERITVAAPVAFQDTPSGRIDVHSSFAIDGEMVRIEVGAYDASRTLTIDPMIGWGTYLGGGGIDTVQAVAASPFPGESDIVFVAGYTSGFAFPAMPQPVPPPVTFDDTTNGGEMDGFIAKIDTSKTGLAALEFLTYLGGSSSDHIGDIAVNANGIYAVGNVNWMGGPFPGLSGFPITADAAKTATHEQDMDEGFLSVLTPDGAGLVYSTWVGGDYPYSVCEPVLGFCYYATMAYVGDRVLAVDIGPDGLPVIAGITLSYPVPGFDMDTFSAFQPTHANTGADGMMDAFVAKYDPSKAGLLGVVYQTFIGGNGHDWANDVRVDDGGTAWVVGATIDLDAVVYLYCEWQYTGVCVEDPNAGAPKSFPARPDAYQSDVNNANAPDAFLVAIPADGAAGDAMLPFATLFGGSAGEDALGLTLTGAMVGEPGQSAVYVTGYTGSAYEPEFMTIHPGESYVHQDCLGINTASSLWCADSWWTSDAFVVKFDPAQTGASQVTAGTYIGTWSSAESAHDVIVRDGSLYVLGGTTNAWQWDPSSATYPAWQSSDTYNVLPQGNKFGSKTWLMKLDDTLVGPDPFMPYYNILIGGSWWTEGTPGGTASSGEHMLYFPQFGWGGLWIGNSYSATVGGITPGVGTHRLALLEGDPVIGSAGLSSGVSWTAQGIQANPASWQADGVVARITKAPPYFPKPFTDSQCRINSGTSSLLSPVSVPRATLADFNLGTSFPPPTYSAVVGALPTDYPVDTASYKWWLKYPASYPASPDQTGVTSFSQLVAPTTVPGTYQVHVEVQDTSGILPDMASTDCWMKVVNKDPIAVISGPTTSTVGGTVTLDSLLGTPAGTRDDDGTITQMQWNVNDLSGMTCVNPATGAVDWQSSKLKCTFTTPGVRTFILAVTDNDGASCATNYPALGWPTCLNAPPAKHTVTVPNPALLAPVANFAYSMDDPMSTGTLGPLALYTCGDWAVVDFASTSTTVPGGAPLSSFAWDFDADGTADATGPSVSHAFPGAGAYAVVLTVTDTAGLTAQKALTVTVTQQANPVADLIETSGQGAPYPPDAPLAFTDVSTYPGAAFLSRSWTVDGAPYAAAGASFTQAFAPGTHTVALEVRDAKGCTATDTMTFDVKLGAAPTPTDGVQIASPAGPQAAFAYLPQPVAVDDVVRFEDLSVPGVAPIASLDWDFGDGLTAQGLAKPTHRYSDEGTYEVRLKVRDLAGMEDEAVQQVRVGTAAERARASRHVPVADAGADIEAFAGELVQLDGRGSSGSGLSFAWTQVEGMQVPLSGAATPQPTFVAPILKPGQLEHTLLLRLIVTDGATASHPDTVAVHVVPSPGPGFGHDADGEAVRFEAERVPAGSNLTWAFGDGTTGYGTRPEHVYAKPGTYDVELTVAGAGPTTVVEKTIEVGATAAPKRASEGESRPTVLGLDLGVAVLAFVAFAVLAGVALGLASFRPRSR